MVAKLLGGGLLSLVLASGLLLMSASRALPQSEYRSSPITKVVLLGTGTPGPIPDRSGPCVAVVVNDTPYLVDLGPGVVRRAMAAYQKGVKGLHFSHLKTAFITHLHSDHTVGYPDFIFTPWVVGRTGPVEVHGPDGIKAMTGHILAAWKEDIRIRTEGMEKDFPEHNDTGYKVNVHEIKPGIVYRDQNVTVKAFAVAHGEVPHAFGYRFERDPRPDHRDLWGHQPEPVRDRQLQRVRCFDPRGLHAEGPPCEPAPMAAVPAEVSHLLEATGRPRHESTAKTARPVPPDLLLQRLNAGGLDSGDAGGLPGPGRFRARSRHLLRSGAENRGESRRWAHHIGALTSRCVVPSPYPLQVHPHPAIA